MSHSKQKRRVGHSIHSLGGGICGYTNKLIDYLVENSIIQLFTVVTTCRVASNIRLI